MNPIETIAIAKLVKDKAEKLARKGITSGIHDTDFWLHVFGAVEVGDAATTGGHAGRRGQAAAVLAGGIAEATYHQTLGGADLASFIGARAGGARGVAHRVGGALLELARLVAAHASDARQPAVAVIATQASTTVVASVAGDTRGVFAGAA